MSFPVPAMEFKSQLFKLVKSYSVPVRREHNVHCVRIIKSAILNQGLTINTFQT